MILPAGNRYYDPATSQFTQPDPIGIAGGLNSYGFAAGDPGTYADPTPLRLIPEIHTGYPEHPCVCTTEPWLMFRIALCTALLIPLSACSEGGCLAIGAPVDLLAQPYPAGYPSTVPAANRVVRRLSAGQYSYSERVYGDDYLVYKLRLDDGAVGYVVFDSQTIREC